MAQAIDDAANLDDLAEEFAARLRAGEHPSIEDYAARHPALRDELRAVLSGVAMLEKFKPEAGSSGPRRPQVSPPPEKLGEFRIVRELGRGGMGVVYEAVQETLHRHVALKLLPGHWASSDKLRARFRREALAAARLHHTNIVPVFSVGEIDGFCYYAMQLIRGTSLDRLRSRGEAETSYQRVTPADSKPAAFVERSAILPPIALLAETNPAEFIRTIVGIGVQAADALSYAHAHGVLHRDIKPSNLILDESSTVWVTDFGVARLADDGNLTQSGDVVGTLRYMPPERFAGHSDERGDVYSLGMTLYELLARQAAWPDTSPQRLMKLIAETDPPRLASLNSHVGRDLETVIQTAIAREPERRYPTTKAFAEDLHRVLDDRPIMARRANLISRAVRWCRRNPSIATAASVVMLSMACITVIAVAASLRTSAAKADTEQALQRETEQREQAERISELSLESLNRTFTEFAPTRLVVAPVVSVGDQELPPQPAALMPEAVPLLEQLLQTYEKIAALAAQYPKLQAQAAEANHRMGDIQQRLGRPDQAEKAYRAAESLYAVLPAEDNESLVVKRARVANELGRTCRALNRWDECRAFHKRAIDLIDHSPANEAAQPEAKYEQAAANYCLGRRDMFVMATLGPVPGDRGSHSDGGFGRHDHGPLPDGERKGPPPSDKGKSKGPPPDWDRGFGPPGEGKGPRGRGAPGENANIADAIKILTVLYRDYPEVAEYRHLLARCHGETRGPGIDEGVKLLRGLVADFPRVPDYQFDLCETLSQPGPGSKREWLEEAVSRSQTLMAQYPRVPDYAAAHARYLDRLGMLETESGHPETAEASQRKAVRIQRDLVERCPNVLYYRIWLGMMERSLGDSLANLNKLDEALPLLKAAVERNEEIYKQNPHLTGVKMFLGHAYSTYAEALTKAGQTDQAAEIRRKANQYGGGMRKKPRKD